MGNFSPKGPRSRWQVAFCTVLALAIFAVSMNTLVFGSKCDMEKNLNQMLLNLLSTFENAKVRCYLDDGTLLGFYRDGHITSYEFDLDISIPFEAYETVLSLKQHLKDEFDYTLYKEGDYIFQKAWTMAYTLTWDPYLPHNYPCFRIYDPSLWYYADIYCDHKANKTEMLAITKFPPEGYDDPQNEHVTYLCDYEKTPECCFMEHVIYPLGSLPGLGRPLPVPHDIPTFLSQVYGKNGWQVPHAKGVKIIICHPVGWWVALIVSMALVVYLLMPLRNYWRDHTARPFPRPAKLGP